MTSYRVRITSSDGYMIEKHLEPTSTSIVFDNLPSNYEFSVQVQAIYGTVYGTFSEPFIVSTSSGESAFL